MSLYLCEAGHTFKSQFAADNCARCRKAGRGTALAKPALSKPAQITAALIDSASARARSRAAGLAPLPRRRVAASSGGGFFLNLGRRGGAERRGIAHSEGGVARLLDGDGALRRRGAADSDGSITTGVAMSGAAQRVARVAIQVDYAESAPEPLLRIDLWSMTGKPQVAVAVALTEQEAKALIGKLKGNIASMKRWHARRRTASAKSSA